MNFSLSKTSWGLLIALLALNTLFLTGTVTGIVPDLLRIALAVATIVSVGVDWRNARLC